MSEQSTLPDIRLLDGQFYSGDPHPAWRWMRENAPVYRDREAEIWGIALYEDVMRIAKDPETFCSRHSSRRMARCEIAPSRRPFRQRCVRSLSSLY